ncbi:STAS domain-containing protein [Actinoplanes sp. NPDC051861]|uniref:STAS domain-containing protein n=1 Tax=Actinoplanes sp. NPDC051861 TaxID=3155170 RepID=UPI003441DCCF
MTASFALGAEFTRADIPVVCASLIRLAATLGDGEIVCDVSAVTRPDVVTVEMLTRLALAARRAGGRLVFTGVSAELRQLMELLGLREVLLPGEG